MKKAAAKPTTGEKPNAIGTFGITLIDIGWRLAAIVIGSIWLGQYLDNRFNAKPIFSLLSVVLIAFGFYIIVSRSVKQLPKEFGGKK